MKEAVLTGICEMAVRETEKPTVVNPDEVLLRIGAIGVCGSDVHYYTTGRIGSQVVEYPYRVGHEFGATVEDVGSSVTRVTPGQVVAVDPAIACGQCDQCLAGREHTCRKIIFLGCPGQTEGCLAEYIVMPERCCFPVGEGITVEEAALCEPLSIGYYAVQQAMPLKGRHIGILGCGPIGLSVLLPARVQGVASVYVTDKIDARLTVAEAAGADGVGNPGHEDIVAAVAGKAPALLDTVFECCGQQDALDQAVELLKPGGTLMLVGIPEEDRVSFAMDDLRRKEIRIQNVRRQNGCVQPTLEMMSSGALQPGFMVTHRFSLDEVQEAFELVHNYRDGVVKAMVAP